MVDIKLQRHLDYTSSYYYEPPKYYTTKAPYYYTTTHAVLSYYTESPQYYSSLSHTTNKAPEYCTNKAPEYYTTMYTAPAYYTEAPKYYATQDRGTAHLHIMVVSKERKGNRNQSIGHLIYDTATTAVSALQTIRHQLHSSSYYQFAIMVKYGVVLLLHVILFMVGSTGMKISPGMTSINKNIRNNRLLQRPPSTTPPGLQKNTIIYAAPSYYAECSHYYSSPGYTTNEISTTPRVRITTPSRHRSTTKLRMLRQLATPRLQLLHRGSSYCNAPSFTTTTDAVKYYVATTFYSTAAYTAPSYYVEPKYCTEAPVYYITSYAIPSYYTGSLKYYSAHSNYTTKAPEYYTTTYAFQIARRRFLNTRAEIVNMLVYRFSTIS